MALTDHAAIWAQSCNDNVNTTIDLAQPQMNQITASCKSHGHSKRCQDSCHTDTKGKGEGRQPQRGRIQHSRSDALGYGRMVSMKSRSNQVNSAVAHQS